MPEISIMNKRNRFSSIIGLSCSLLLTIVCLTAKSQEAESPVKKTILNSKATVRLVSKAGIRATKVDHSIALMAQPSIGILFNEKLFAGIATDLALNEQSLKDASYKSIKDETSRWEFNYTGLNLEYIFSPLRSISPGIGLYTGWGKAERNFTWNSLSKQSPEWALVDKNFCRKGYFFFAEPSVSLSFNLSQSVSLKANAGYRFVNFNNTIAAMQMPDKKFNGLSGAMTVMFSNIFKTSR